MANRHPQSIGPHSVGPHSTILQSPVALSPALAAAPRLHFIDGLRGVAMLMVLLYHCWLFAGMWSVGLTLGSRSVDVAPLLGFGHIGVNLFLVLSGFCLYWPFVKGGRRREPTLWEFAKKRCRRILPPYYATLALFGGLAAFAALHRHDSVGAIYVFHWLWLHALMLHNLRPEYILKLNGSLWSLALEFQLYLLFPVLVEAYRRFNARGVLFTVLAVCSAYRFFLVQGQYLPDDDYGYVLAYSLFGRAFEFSLGMFAALMIARRHAEGKWSLKIGDGLVLAAVTFVAVLDGRHGHFQVLTDAMWGMLFAALVLAGSSDGTWLNRALSHRLLVFLGLFSYSVYLIHLPLVLFLGQYALAHFAGTGRALFMLFFTVPVMLCLGYVFHRIFERPFMGAPRPAKKAMPGK